MYKVTVRSALGNEILNVISKISPEFSILDKKVLSNDTTSALVKIILNKSTENSMELLQKMPFIKFDYFVIDQNIILANIIFANKTFEKALLISPACACSLKHVSMHNGALVQKHVIKDKACFQKHLREFEKSNKVFDVIYTEATTGELTAKQHDILRKAFELGYYDFPRKADLHKLANLLGVAPASALQNLRAATKKVIQKYLD